MKHRKYVPISSVEYMATHQKYAPVPSRTVFDATSEICQYLVVQYMMKHHKYVPVSTCTIHDETT
jgi:hypothetical protein